MKSLRLEEPTEEEPGLLITSMIDVIFMLLMFFVCVSEVKKGKLNVELSEVPEVQQQAPQEGSPAEPIVVEVNARDEVWVCGEAAPDDAAVKRMIDAAVARLGKEAPVHLSGDRQAKNGTMMRVVSHLTRAGLTRIEFAVEAGG